MDTFPGEERAHQAEWMGKNVMNHELICVIPTLAEIIRKWDDEIEHSEDKSNWLVWKKSYIERFQQGDIIPYYGMLHGVTICEATAHIHARTVQNAEGLVGNGLAYLSAFRTIPACQGKGYFSVLFRYMLHDLKEKGYTKVTLGVEPSEEKNRQIYRHYGFTEFVKSGTETYPDGTIIQVDYFAKTL